jgi:hypothetical protein
MTLTPIINCTPKEAIRKGEIQKSTACPSLVPHKSKRSANHRENRFSGCYGGLNLAHRSVIGNSGHIFTVRLADFPTRYSAIVNRFPYLLFRDIPGPGKYLEAGLLRRTYYHDRWLLTLPATFSQKDKPGHRHFQLIPL